jgi:hypothetical protein
MADPAAKKRQGAAGQICSWPGTRHRIIDMLPMFVYNIAKSRPSINQTLWGRDSITWSAEGANLARL